MEQARILVDEARRRREEIHHPTWADHKKTLLEIIAALGAQETYLIHRNLYLAIGLVWSLPVLLAIWLMAALQQDLGFSVGALIRLLRAEPIYLSFIAFPVLFTLFLAALGQVKHRRDRYIRALLQELESNVRRLTSVNEELKELDRLRDEFTSNITHELRTPLVTTRGYTDMLLSGDLGSIDDTQRRSLKVILKNVMRLIELIDRILQFRRMGSAPLPRQLRPFPLRHLLKDLEENFRPTFLGKDISFSIELPDRPVMVVGDRSRIERVFANLLANAGKFTQIGGEIRIRVAAPEGGRVNITVEDNGCGIPAEAQAHIFDRYRQADGSVRRRFGGAGLGLAIVKRILQAHGVDITVQSEEGKGARFLFQLPVMVDSTRQFENASPDVLRAAMRKESIYE